MSTSTNGWLILARDELVWFTAAGARFAAASDDVAFLAAHLITRFDAEVEPLAGPVLDEWSYNVRMVRGSATSRSNHGSATAWDLNATRHPRGVARTFTSAQIVAVRRILNSIIDDNGRPVFRWGHDYRDSPIDDMHFEINATRVRVAQARRLLEDDVTPADIKAIAEEVVKLMTSTANVPNQKLHPTDKPAANFTEPGALSNIELNQDQENERTAADRERDAVTRRQIAEIHSAVVKAPAKPTAG